MTTLATWIGYAVLGWCAWWVLCLLKDAAWNRAVRRWPALDTPREVALFVATGTQLGVGACFNKSGFRWAIGGGNFWLGLDRHRLVTQRRGRGARRWFNVGRLFVCVPWWRS